MVGPQVRKNDPIDSFYNTRRRHGWCGGISPIGYEQQQKINNAGYPSAA